VYSTTINPWNNPSRNIIQGVVESRIKVYILEEVSADVLSNKGINATFEKFVNGVEHTFFLLLLQKLLKIITVCTSLERYTLSIN